MSVLVDLQLASTAKHIPDASLFSLWADAALKSSKPDAELSIRIVDEAESQRLNSDYRQQDKPTNVLSFPADIPEFLELALIGDLVICAPIVEREATEQQKMLTAHWAHMVIHGALHLVGYDHIEDNDADTMEALEIHILDSLGFPSPYTAN
ncbi:MAG: putative rRNA maturation factor [Kiritimatiellia bacterium]|jgi:probable rRNA maturation factor